MGPLITFYSQIQIEGELILWVIFVLFLLMKAINLIYQCFRLFCSVHTKNKGNADTTQTHQAQSTPSPFSLGPSSPSLISRLLGNSSTAVCHSAHWIFKMKSVCSMNHFCLASFAWHEYFAVFFFLAWVFWNSSISWLIYLALSYSSLCDWLYNMWLFWWLAGPFPACV